MRYAIETVCLATCSTCATFTTSTTSGHVPGKMLTAGAASCYEALNFLLTVPDAERFSDALHGRHLSTTLFTATWFSTTGAQDYWTSMRLLEHLRRLAYRANFSSASTLQRDHRARDLVQFLDQADVGLVFDVCSGGPEFATSLLRAGFEGTVLSFEHREPEFENLDRACLQLGREGWAVFPRNSVAGLAASPAYRVAASKGQGFGEREPQFGQTPAPSIWDEAPPAHLRLDKIIRALELVEPTYLKIGSLDDALHILQGASDSLDASVLGVEISTCEYGYSNFDRAFVDVSDFMMRRGLHLHHVSPHVATVDRTLVACADLVFRR